MNQLKEDIMQGEEHLLHGRTDEAFRIFDSILEKEPNNVLVLNNKGVAYNRMGKYEEAIELFRCILQQDGNNSNAAFNLIANYIAIGKWEAVQSGLDQFRHCLTETDTKMITDDLRKFRSDGGSIYDGAENKIVAFSLSAKNSQYDLKLSLDLNQYSQKIIWNFISEGHSYEPETCEFAESVLKAGDCFLDIGAHIGYFSILAAKIVGHNGKVLSFEPEKNNYDRLRHNIALNNQTNIKTFDIALSSEDRQGELFVNSDNDGGHALWDVRKHPLNEKSRSDLVKQRLTIAPLDKIIQTEPVDRIKLIKIDTEGAEHNILLGSSHTLKKCKVPYIICEINRFGLKQMDSSETQLREFMQELGYETYLIRPEEPKLRRLSPGDQVETNYVFNVVFIKPENLI